MSKEIVMPFANYKPVEAFSSVSSLSKLLRESDDDPLEKTLKYGAQYGREDVVKLALSRGATEYEEAAVIAARNGHPNIISCIIEKQRKNFNLELWLEITQVAMDELEVLLLEKERSAEMSNERSDYDEIISMTFLYVHKLFGVYDW